MSKQKIMAGLIAILMVITLPACGSQTETLQGPTPAPEPTEEPFDLTKVLTEEPWIRTEDGKNMIIAFYKTGTGWFDGSTESFGFEWEPIEGFEKAIREKHTLTRFSMGEVVQLDIVSDFEVRKENERWILEPMGGRVSYMRVSDHYKELYGMTE